MMIHSHKKLALVALAVTIGQQDDFGRCFDSLFVWGLFYENAQFNQPVRPSSSYSHWHNDILTLFISLSIDERTAVGVLEFDDDFWFRDS